VPRAAPGDRLRVRLTERHADFGRAEILAVVAPGHGRRDAPCPHYAECGGCQLQHLDEREQLRAKSAATVETVRRLSRLDLPPPHSIVTGASWGYRLRTQVHVEAREGGPAVGYHGRSSRELVAVASCPILEPALEAAVVGLAERLPAPPPARVDLAAGDGGEIATAPPVPGLAAGTISRRVAGFDLRFDARTFFQGHGGLLDRLVALAVGDGEGESAFDLFGGVGLFALPLARRYRRVVTVDGDRLAGRYARQNARRARLANVECVTRPVEGWIAEGYPDGADRVVVDPPRSGLPFLVRKLLVARPARRLTYVSCHPATLARDLAELGAAYRIESWNLIDLFPQTGHIEAVVEMASGEV